MPVGRSISASLHIGSLVAASVLTGCYEPEREVRPSYDVEDRASTSSGLEPLIPMDTGPVYHVLDGYDRRWVEQLREGIQRASDYWGGYGPTHVWIGERGIAVVGFSQLLPFNDAQAYELYRIYEDCVFDGR